jgi:hypothetical protein
MSPSGVNKNLNCQDSNFAKGIISFLFDKAPQLNAGNVRRTSEGESYFNLQLYLVSFKCDSMLIAFLTNKRCTVEISTPCNSGGSNFG